jgi:hypothetical protein
VVRDRRWVVRSEAKGSRGEVAGERLRWCRKGFSKRVEEARKCGSEKEIQRDGRGRGRGRYYYPPRTPDWHSNLPKPKPFSPLSLPWHALAPASVNAATPSGPPFLLQ